MRNRLLITILFIVPIVPCVAAEDAFLFSIRMENEMPKAVQHIEHIDVEDMTQEGPLTYRLQDQKGKVLSTGAFGQKHTQVYDTFGDDNRLTGGVVAFRDYDVFLLTPMHRDATTLQIWNGKNMLLEEDLTQHPEFEQARMRMRYGIDGDNNCVTIQNNGPPSQKLGITFVAHGYSNEQLPTFINHVMESKDYLLSIVPFNTNGERINVHYVNQSFDLGCYANCLGTPRLICCNESRVWAAGRQCPWSFLTTKFVVLANGLPYGGASALGATWLVVSNAESMKELVAHEFGHAFSMLFDEYDYGSSSGEPPPMIIPNCDVPPCNRWSSVPGTLCLQVCGYNNHYRSVENSLMRSLSTNDYGPVSIRNMTWRLQQFNVAPRIISTPIIQAQVRGAYTYQVIATDGNNDTLTYTLTQKPLRMSINSTTGLITWNPVISESRGPIVRIVVSDNRGGSAAQQYTIRLL